MAFCFPERKEGDILDEEVHEEVDPTMYRGIIGSLRSLYHTRPDICFATGLVRRHMNKPLKPCLLAAKRVLRYLKGTLHYGILFPKGKGSEESELVGYLDSDWCGEKVYRSTSGYPFKFNGAPISWSSRKQSVVALSSCEAEYVVAGSAAACQANWLESLLEDLHLKGSQPMRLMVDNKSAIN